MTINAILILTLSTSWAIYLIQKILKDYKIEKMQTKLRNSYPEHFWSNAMKNFKSNRTKNILILAICVSEVIINTVLFYDKYDHFIIKETNFPNEGWFTNVMKSGIISSDVTYTYFSYSIFCTYTFFECVSTFLIRILTQHMVYQYSYYMTYLNIHPKRSFSPG